MNKKKDIILKVKINNFDLDMQMDTGNEVTLIPKYFWELEDKFEVIPKIITT